MQIISRADPSSGQQTLTCQQALDLAIQHHTAGDLSNAENIYQQILNTDPNQPDALHLQGVIAHQRGENDRAVDLIMKSLAIKPDFAEAHNNLGLVLKKLKKLDEAAASCHKALSIKPEFAEAHLNLGATFEDQGIPEEAITCYHKAIEIKPDFATAHNNLGNALKNLRRLDEAIASYHKALAIKPDYAEAHGNLGNAFEEQGKLKEAINCYERANTTLSRAKLLECVYTLGQKDRFYRLLEKITQEDKINLGVAAISAFGSNQFGCRDPYPFCNRPLDFIYLNSIASTPDKSSGLLHDIQKQIVHLQLDRQSQALLKSGIQSAGNLFVDPLGALANLENIIRNEIAAYYSKYQEFDFCFIKMWPRKYTLTGWYILMEKGGHLKSHNHPEGWLSGVLYLKMPPTKKDEGYIEFGLHRHDFPILKSNYPKMLYKVKEGDLVMFPSSLFHRTIPFYSNEERLCIAFDLIPDETVIHK